MSEVVIFEQDYGPDGYMAAQCYAARQRFSGVVIYQRTSGESDRYAVEYALQITCKRLEPKEVEDCVLGPVTMVEEPAETPVAVAAEPTKPDGIEHRTEPVEHWIFEGHAYRKPTVSDIGKEVWVSEESHEIAIQYAENPQSFLFHRRILRDITTKYYADLNNNILPWKFAVIRDDLLLDPPTPDPTFQIGDWVLLSDHDEDPEWQKCHNAHVGMLRQIKYVARRDVLPIFIADENRCGEWVKPEWLELTTPPEQWRTATEADIGKPCRYRHFDHNTWTASERLLWVYPDKTRCNTFVCLNETGGVEAFSQCEVLRD